MNLKKGSVISWILLLVLCAACITVYLTVLQNSKNQLSETKKLLAEKQDQLEFMEFGQGKQQLNEMRNNLATSSDTLTKFVCPVESISDITFSISQLASDLGLEQYSCEQRKKSPYEKMEGMNNLAVCRLHINFRSEFNEFARFLNKLEKHQPVIFIDKFSIQPDSKETGKYVDMVLAFFVDIGPDSQKELTHLLAKSHELANANDRQDSERPQ
ncbi:hypothetical protein STSP2_02782 [Anaerohalosphaera lusitana]|uniref:Pilus assembly protein, PilO n=1 Tax=Anaerohalosphaera lusitana TaxID=1936003 RepID=A0A1U9NNW3_9BACT|nr:GspMb/PilO family protein [Anaerohalosphaera lusitana]AQT69589.1 hypothetical protein STSP2_02782 [Anaerohalosphaera lusitana]